MTLPIRDWRALLALSGELAEFAEGDADAAADHALSTLYGLTGSAEGFITFATLALPAQAATDPLRGWRPVRTLYNRRAAERTRATAEWYGEARRLTEDVATNGLAGSAGRPRAFLRDDLTNAAPRAIAHHETALLDALGVRDRVYAALTVAPGVEAVIGLDRLRGGRRFGPRQRELLGTAAPHLQWLLRRLGTQLGVIGQALPHLSPRERTTLHALLDARTPKTIARDMGISGHTAHQYVKSIYRKLRVSSRAQLMARCKGVAPRRAAERAVTYDARRGLRLEFVALSADGSAADNHPRWAGI